MSIYSFNGISEQGKAGKHRMDDAQVLLGAARWRGAMYMAGYRVECLLKTKLMRKYKCHNLEELEEELHTRGLLAEHATIYTHQLHQLLRMTGAMDRMRENPANWQSFAIVNTWIPAWRYNPDSSNPDAAKDFLKAVEDVSQWVENNI